MYKIKILSPIFVNILFNLHNVMIVLFSSWGILSMIFLSSSFLLAGDIKEDALKLEAKAIENHLKMKVFEIILEHAPGSEDKIENYDHIRTHYFVDNDKLRIDTTFQLTADIPEGVNVSHEYTSIESWDHDQSYLFQTGMSLYNGQAAGLALIAHERNKNEVIDRADCRLLGLLPMGLTAVAPLNLILTDPNRKNFSVSEETVNGIPCKKIYSEYPNGAFLVAWIAPSQGYSVLRMEMSAPDGSLVDRTDYTVAEYKKSGIWFPVTSEYHRTENGKVTKTQNIAVQIVSLNKPLLPETFNPKGFGVPLGKRAYIEGKHQTGALYWDGTKIANEEETTLNSIPTRGNVIRYLLIAAGLVMLSTGCLMKYFELTKKNRKPSDD